MEEEEATGERSGQRGCRPTEGPCPNEKEKFRVNRKLLPIKIFYFMSNAAMSCMVPYLLVFMKKHGLSSEESGILVGVMPFLAFLAQPLVGMAADRWEKHKAILMAVTFTTGVSIVLITTVPARSRRDVIDGDVVMTCSPHLPLGLRHCVAGVPVADVSGMTVDDECRDAGFRSSESGNGRSLNTGCKIRGVVDKSENHYSCPPDVRNVLNAMQQDDNETLTSKAVCNVACPSQIRNGDTGMVCLTNNTVATSYSFHEGCEIAQYPNFPGTFDIRTLQKQRTDSPDPTVNSSLALSQNEREHCSEVFRVSSLAVDSRVFSAAHCESRREFRCQIRCHLPPGHACRANASTFDLTFWLIFVFYLVGFLALSPVIPMSDAVCYSLLGKEWRKYGHQRVWGTLGWLAVSVGTSVGVYVDEDLDYRYLFYSYGALMGVCTVVAHFIRIPADVRCGNMLKNMGKVLVVPKVMALLVVALVFGTMFGAIGFALWFLEELGAPPQIFGPYSVVGVAVEIPGFFFVGRLIRRFGPIPCVCVATAALSGRLLGYALLGNPWLVLLLEPLHGVAVALMQASATTYVAWVSPPGMAATSQGLLGGVLHILGRAIGTILTGWLFAAVGARVTFALFAGAGFTVAAVYALLYRCFFTDPTPPGCDRDTASPDNDDVTDKDTQIPLVTTPGADRLLSSTVITVQDELLTARSQRSNDGCDPPVCNGTHQE